MWKYRKLDNRNSSTLAQLMQIVPNKSSIKFVIYNLEDDRVELTTDMNHRANDFFKLGDCELECIVHDSEKAKEEARKMGMHIPGGVDKSALLAYDVDSSTVFLIQSAPDVNGISGILMCMVSELMASNVPCNNMVSELINSNVLCDNNVSIANGQDKHYVTDISCNNSCLRGGGAFDNVGFYMQSMESNIDAEAKAFASTMAKRKLEAKNCTRNHVQANYGEVAPTPSVGVVGLNNTKRKVGIV